MDVQLRALAESRYGQPEFLSTLFELALEDQWLDLQHLIQHDMAKAILADYSFKLGQGYLNSQIFNDYWEEVIEIGWSVFCRHTGIPRERIVSRLNDLHNAI
jgi:hypothetical protein